MTIFWSEQETEEVNYHVSGFTMLIFNWLVSENKTEKLRNYFLRNLKKTRLKNL